MKTKFLGIIVLIITLLLFIKCKKDDNEHEKPITIDAGNDIENVEGFWIILNADSLKVGESGEWSVLKGLVDNKVYFENKKLPKTKFFGLPGESYLLQWKLLKNNKYYYDSVHISFSPIKINIIREENSSYSTRVILYINSQYEGQWTINGDVHHWESTQLGGVIVPKEKYPRIKIYGRENGTIHAKWTAKYGSVSFSDTLSIRTVNYTEYEALEDLQLLGSARYKVENGHVIEIYLGGDGRGWKFGAFDMFPALGSLKYLRKLILDGDGIGIFSSSIPLFYKNLKYLDLSFNEISELPSNIGELKQLETLLLGTPQAYASIRTLPESFGGLENLKYLDLSSNNISELPSTFGNLTKLETLMLWGSTINKFPTEFGNLKSLRVLYLSGVKENLPESFSQLTNLTEFYANSYSSSSMSKLPENIGNLKSLQVLILRGNNTFQILPNSFCELDSLKELELSCKNLLLPLNFGNLKKLWNLTLSCDINEIPSSFSNLSSLVFFTINGINNTSTPITLPQDIEKNVKLSGIYLNKVNIHLLPNSIGNLPNLCYLKIQNCSLDSIPSSIGDLKMLKDMCLDYNNLSIIPENLKKLKGLDYVILYGNPNLAWQIEQIRSWNISRYLYY